jgi:threonine/homoserine/homoserine lactone efflux protein
MAVGSLPSDLALGMVLGFSLTIPPGPMNALIAARSTESFRRGFLTGLGAMSADLILAIAVYALQSAVDLASEVRIIYVLGCGVMAFLAYRLLSAGSRRTAPEPRQLAVFTSALAVGLSNPFQILWWLTAGLAFAYLGGYVLFVGLFGAILIWIVAFPFAIHRGVRRYPGLARAVTVVSAAALLGFAAYFAILAI